MIPTLDPDQESNFPLFGDSRSGLGSTKKRNDVMIRQFNRLKNPLEKPLEKPL